MYVIDASVDVRNSTFSGNSSYLGGGMGINWNTAVTITNSTFVSNTVSNAGGGVRVDSGTLAITNTTFSGNSATWGGGLHSYYGEVTIANSTFAGNTAGQGASIDKEGLGTIVPVKNTILFGSGSNCYGVSNGGYDIDSGSSCGFGSTNGSMSNTDPKLGPLQDNGGSTCTQALLPGSPAIDAGHPTDYAPYDQRGVRRPQGSRSDIGAFELVQTATTAPATACTTAGPPVYRVFIPATFRSYTGSW